jgi:hypothetical protein
LATASNSGEANWLFNKPTDVAFSKNGDIYVTDGYGNSRVVKFDRDGNFIKAWGTYGSGPGEFILLPKADVQQSRCAAVPLRRGFRMATVGSVDPGLLRLFNGLDFRENTSARPADAMVRPLVNTMSVFGEHFLYDQEKSSHHC